MNKKAFFMGVLSLALILPFFFASAADYLPKNKKGGGNVVVSGEEIFHNLYVGGGSVVINKNILGDLFAAGGAINVASEIEEDLFAAGGNVTVAGPVGGDARLAGGNIAINAPVGGDALLAGGTILIGGNADVGGDLWAAGGAVNITSDVAGNVKVAGGEIFINAKIGGQLQVQSEKLVFGPLSDVQGSINYTGTEEAVIQEGAQIGNIEYKHFQGNKKIPSFGNFKVFVLVKFLALLIAGLILLKLFGKTSQEIVSSGYERFWSNAGIGLAGMIVVPIVSVLLMITVIGFYAAFVLLAWFFLMIFLGALYSVMLLGAILEKFIRKEKDVWLSWMTILWGAIAGAVIGLIPFVGWLVICLFYLVGFGTLLRKTKQRLEI